MFPRYGPVELWRKIVEMVDDIGAKEVEKIRTDLVQEREGFWERHTKAMVEYGACDYRWVT